MARESSYFREERPQCRRVRALPYVAVDFEEANELTSQYSKTKSSLSVVAFQLIMDSIVNVLFVT